MFQRYYFFLFFFYRLERIARPPPAQADSTGTMPGLIRSLPELINFQVFSLDVLQVTNFWLNEKTL